MKLQLEKQKEQEQQVAPEKPRSILKKSGPVVKRPAAATTTTSGLSSLLADYDDSESDSDDDKRQQQQQQQEDSTPRVVSWPQDDSKLKKTRIIEAPSEEPRQKRARFHHVADEQQQQNEQSGLKEEQIKAIEAEMGITSSGTQEKTVNSAETEHEFQALLDDQADDDDETMKNNEDMVDMKQQQEELDVVDITEMEQVSYEARIAQLRLKAAARRNKKTSKPSAQATLVPVATFTPELALGNNDEEEEISESDSLTPLEILRRKRQEARKQAQGP